MNKRLLIILCYVLIFAAGTTMGLVVRSPQADEPHKHHSDLNEQLGLNEEQEARMKQIWFEELRRDMREVDEYRRSLYGKRKEALREAMPADAQVKFDEIYAEYDRKLDETDDLRRKTFESAREKTREMLTEDQRAKFDEIMSHRRSMYESRGSKWGGRGHDRDRDNRGDDRDSQTEQPAAPPEGESSDAAK